MGDNDELMVVCPKGMKISREEYVKVIIQALHSLGYPKTAKHLNTTRGFSYIHQPTKFENLRTQFVNGFWEQCAETLYSIDGLDQDRVSMSMSLIFLQWLAERLALNPNLSKSDFLQNKYISRLHDDHREGIITFMDTFIDQTPSHHIDGLKDPACVVKVRKMRLKSLEEELAPLVEMFDNRLLALVESAHSAQINSCLSHNAESGISNLYKDHSCDTDQLPTTTLQVLIGHTDAILCVKFSHNGQYLASASRDHTAIIWEVLDAWRGLSEISFVLRGHSAPVSCVSWSSDDEMLLTCARGEVLRAWDMHTRECICLISEEEPVLRSCALVSDRYFSHIIYGTLKPPRTIFDMILDENAEQVLCSGTGESLIVDFAITPNGSKLINIFPEGKIVILDLHTKEEENISEEAEIMGARVSEDNKSLILNLSNHQIHVWDLSLIKAGPSIYYGHKQSASATHSCTGGLESAFLVSGSEDSNVYIWNRKKEDPLVVLSGHSTRVNCVSWNPECPEILASAGDDGTVRIWGSRCLKQMSEIARENSLGRIEGIPSTS